MRGGLYQIRNTINGDRYVGRSIDFVRRWRDHRTRLARGGCDLRYLQNAWNKYSAAAFVFEPLIECSPEDAILIEQSWLDKGFGEYNVSRSARTPVKAGEKLRPEVVAKIAAAQRGIPKKPRPDVAERNKTAEHRAIISAATKGVPKLSLRGRVRSPEYRAKMAASLVKGREAQNADPTFAARRLATLVRARAALAAKVAEQRSAYGNS